MTGRHYDVIIIGTGAGGGTLLYRLAPSGKRILVLERGEYVSREKDNLNPRAVNLEGKYQTKESWLDKDGQELHPHTSYCVGGNTKFYGAALVRLRREDFGELRHGGGISPAWPISYEDLEPYYTRAERIYQVRGNRGEDPTEPPAAEAYSWPAIPHEPRIEQLAEDFARASLKPFHMPLGVMLDENKARQSRCIRCGTCDGYPCLLNAKSDAQVVCVDEAVKYPNVTLLTQSFVKLLETNFSGRQVTSVWVERGGWQECYSADLVVVSCGAVNSTALMLRSTNDKHPRGLANSSDLVGRNYMSHTNSVLMAISGQPNNTIFQKTLGLNDFYFGSDDWNYPLGHISFVGKLDAITLRSGAPSITPDFALELAARHSLDFWLMSEDLPDPNNRVTLNRQGRIVLSYTPNNLEAHKRLQHKLKQAMKKALRKGNGRGALQRFLAANLYAGQRIPLAGVAHQNGTMRFGHDPSASVLDVNCKAHDLDNLYVVDGSFFPSSAAVNPALTIMANALRVGDHLLEVLGA